MTAPALRIQKSLQNNQGVCLLQHVWQLSQKWECSRNLHFPFLGSSLSVSVDVNPSVVSTIGLGTLGVGGEIPSSGSLKHNAA